MPPRTSTASSWSPMPATSPPASPSRSPTPQPTAASSETAAPHTQRASEATPEDRREQLTQEAASPRWATAGPHLALPLKHALTSPLSWMDDFEGEPPPEDAVDDMTGIYSSRRI